MKDITGICLTGAIVVVVGIVFVGEYLAPPPNSGNKTRTKAMLSDVVNAVKAYQLEYNTLPVDEGVGHDVEIVFDGSAEGVEVLQALIGEATAIGSRENANPREIVFIEPDLSNGESIGMVFEGDVAVRLLDSWGQPLHIVLDGDGDRYVTDPKRGDEIRKQVIVWSEGMPSDEDEDASWENDVKSWE